MKKVADFVGMTNSGKFFITEVKQALGTTGADIGTALRQIENTIAAIIERVPGAKFERIEIAIPQGAVLQESYQISSGGQLIRVIDGVEELIRTSTGNVVWVRQYPL